MPELPLRLLGDTWGWTDRADPNRFGIDGRDRPLLALPSASTERRVAVGSFDLAVAVQTTGTLSLDSDPLTEEYDSMAEHVRVATFDADETALESLVNEIESGGGPPEDLPAKSVLVLTDRSAGKVVVIVRFGSEDDLKQGSETLDAMNPPSGGMRRVSVENYEVVLEQHAP